jgi:hypothetical protein
MIPFAEKQIEGPLNYGETKRKVGGVGDIEEHTRLRQHLLGTAQAFLNRGGAAHERTCDLSGAKAANKL